jgi:hypothetical protein
MKFTNYLIYRHGSNRANQELCNKLPVAIVAATSRQEACRIARQSVIFYANQTAEAIPESKANATDWDFVCEVAAQSDEFFVG